MSAPTAEAVSAFVRMRVRVEVANGDVHERTLSALTPLDVLILADPQVFVVRVPRSDVHTIVDAQYACSECGRRTNTRYAEDRCADCYRVWCAQQSVPSETCEDCGSQGAVYSPKFKVWRCAQCHAKNASFMGSTVEMRVLTDAAICRSDDKDSPRHDWKKMKSQYVCKLCKVKVFGKPAYADKVR